MLSFPQKEKFPKISSIACNLSCKWNVTDLLNANPTKLIDDRSLETQLGEVRLFFFQHHHILVFQVFLSHVVFFVLHIYTYTHASTCPCTHTHTHTTSMGNTGGFPKKRGWDQQLRVFRDIPPPKTRQQTSWRTRARHTNIPVLS